MKIKNNINKFVCFVVTLTTANMSQVSIRVDCADYAFPIDAYSNAEFKAKNAVKSGYKACVTGHKKDGNWVVIKKF